VSDGRTGKFYGILDADGQHLAYGEQPGESHLQHHDLSAGSRGSGWFINLYNVPTRPATQYHLARRFFPILSSSTIMFISPPLPRCGEPVRGGGIRACTGSNVECRAALSPLAGEGSVPRFPITGCGNDPGPRADTVEPVPVDQSFGPVSISSFSTGASGVKIDSPP